MKKHSEAFIKLVEQARQEVKVCTVHDVENRIRAGEVLNLIDVREDNEWAASRIPAAQHISKGIIERDIELHFPDKTQELLLYCGGGYRSALAAQNLQRMGYNNVISVDGGFREWVNAGFKIEE